MAMTAAVGWFVGAVFALTLRAGGMDVSSWPQWRGPSRDGQVAGPAWPTALGDSLSRQWSVRLAPSYSGPIASGELVYVTETRDKSSEVVSAYDRRTGGLRWSREWAGSVRVPFYAASRGSWIRSTPALADDTLFVAGMRDVLVALNAQTGDERWRVDFPAALGSPVPEFGFISSPLVDDGSVYVQASNAVVKVDARTGAIRWRSMEAGGSVMESGAFSSPMMATLAGVRQLVVQSRERIAGLDAATGQVLWSHTVPSFRGMNILTPVVLGDTIFTSTYQNGSFLFRVSRDANNWRVVQEWAMNAQGYMSTPVVVDGYAYLHLANQRLACIDLRTGERKWTTTPFGKYWSLIAQGDRLLALDETGQLRLIRANPERFELLDELTVGEGEAWAHVALAGSDLYVRDGAGLTAYRWTD